MKAYWRRPSQAAIGCAASAITVMLTSASVRGVGVDPDERAVIARCCRDVFDAIRSLCRTTAARAAVGDQIKQVSCGVNSERPAVALENGQLGSRIELEFATSSNSQMISNYLLDYLAVGGWGGCEIRTLGESRSPCARRDPA
jgi:hypothetical protein